MGTGLTECILSGLLSTEGKKVLHIDRHDYYGGECASLNLTQCYEKFKKEKLIDLGNSREWNIDLIPKFMMSSGELVNILVHTGVTNYLEFKQIEGSFVYRNGHISKVPTTEMEALRSPLMGFFEKRRARKFFEFVDSYFVLQEEKQKQLLLSQHGFHLSTTMIEIYVKFGLEQGTQDFIGHALALYSNDDYLTKPFPETLSRIQLYTTSLQRYGLSPYIYTLYGLGELPQAFARLSAVYGGTYMLDKTIHSIQFDKEGKVQGIELDDGQIKIKCSKIIADSSYFPHKVQKTSQVIRCICILNHPIPETFVGSCQIIIPQNQVHRKHGKYIISSLHKLIHSSFL
jgi:Rab GDP dissociation inhibitor